MERGTQLPADARHPLWRGNGPAAEGATGGIFHYTVSLQLHSTECDYKRGEDSPHSSGTGAPVAEPGWSSACRSWWATLFACSKSAAWWARDDRRACRGAHRFRQGVGGAASAVGVAAASPSLAINCAAIPEPVVEVNSSGTHAAHLRAPCKGAPDALRPPTGNAVSGPDWRDAAGTQPKVCALWQCGSYSGWAITRRQGRAHRGRHAPAARCACADRRLPSSDLYYRGGHPDSHAGVDPSCATPAAAGESLPRERVRWQDRGSPQELVAHGWRGNVRELEHVLERGVILAGEDPVVTARRSDFGLTMS